MKNKEIKNFLIEKNEDNPDLELRDFKIEKEKIDVIYTIENDLSVINDFFTKNLDVFENDFRNFGTILSICSGDRISCCEEVIIAKSDEKMIGFASLSLRGESGMQPSVIGVVVLPEYRGKFIGKNLNLRGILALTNKLARIKKNVEGFEDLSLLKNCFEKKIRIDALSNVEYRILTKLIEDNPVLKNLVEVQKFNDLSDFFSLFTRSKIDEI